MVPTVLCIAFHYYFTCVGVRDTDYGIRSASIDMVSRQGYGEGEEGPNAWWVAGGFTLCRDILDELGFIV